jgi:hypothetical protein
MTFEEEKIYKIIMETEWMSSVHSSGRRFVHIRKVRACWEQLLKIAEGEIELSDLVDPGEV